MKVAIIGTGYVGLTHWTCLAELGNDVICIDVDAQKIEALKSWIIPIFEPKLSDLVIRNYEEWRLNFSTEIKSAIIDSEIIFIAVWTPAWVGWHADMQYVKSVANSIGELMEKYVIVVTKSTVPVGTGDMVDEIIKKKLQERWVNIAFDIASNPEFLKEGTAVDDFFMGDRIVIWCDNPDNKALKKLEELYSPLKETKIIQTDLHTAEIIKYGANSFLAMEISFINILSQLCEKVWADVVKVSEWLKLDSRIWKKAFVNAGPWFWWSCFPKDVMEFAQTFRDYWIENGILESTLLINENQKNSLFEKIKILLSGDIEWKVVTILWLAFKPDTDDIRYSPAINLVESLLKEKVSIKAFDPEAMKNFKKFYPDITYEEDLYSAITWSDCIVVVTDWNEFKQPNWKRITELVSQKNIIDARNLYDERKLLTLGFKYIWIWRWFINWSWNVVKNIDLI